MMDALVTRGGRVRGALVSHGDLSTRTYPHSLMSRNTTGKRTRALGREGSLLTFQANSGTVTQPNDVRTA